MIEKQYNGNIRVENYGLPEWAAEVEQVINQGYKFDFETNEHYPQTMGYLYTAILVPKQDSVGSTDSKPNGDLGAAAVVEQVIKQAKQGKRSQAVKAEVLEVA